MVAMSAYSIVINTLLYASDKNGLFKLWLSQGMESIVTGGSRHKKTNKLLNFLCSWSNAKIEEPAKDEQQASE